MSTTIAVAIITAIATISAGSAAGIISLMTQSRQARQQREVDRLQIRRNAYVELLAKFDEVMEVFDSIWKKPPPADASIDPLEPLYDPINYPKVFRLALNAVYLEGPERVGNAAGGFVELIDEERDAITKCAKENAGQSRRLRDLIDRKRIIDKRDATKNNFYTEAGKALNGDAD